MRTRIYCAFLVSSLICFFASVAVQAEETIPGVEAVVALAGQISGTVTGSAGTPLPDISVDAYSWNGDEWEWVSGETKPEETPAVVVKAEVPFAFENFTVGGDLYAYVDIKKMTTNFTLEVTNQNALGKSIVEFVVTETGFPLFDLVPTATAVKINGEVLDLAMWAEASDPDNTSSFRVLKKKLEAEKLHTLEVDYKIESVNPVLDHDDFGFDNDEVRFHTFMNDTDTPRGFWENYGVSSFEYDQFQHTVNLELKQTTLKHLMFTNGKLTEKAMNSWNITYPDFFNTGGFYIHVVRDGRFIVQQTDYQALEKKVPITIYGTDPQLMQGSLSDLFAEFQFLEANYGPYLYDEYVLYVYAQLGDKYMEFPGATITDRDSLEHEFGHSWFGRGVLPANGNAGWIDEAITTWREIGMPKVNAIQNRAPANMVGNSPYLRPTQLNVYDEGPKLMSEFDFMLRNKGGILPVIGKLYQAYKGKIITTEIFKDFMSKEMGQDLSPIFDRYVYGKAN